MHLFMQTSNDTDVLCQTWNLVAVRVLRMDGYHINKCFSKFIDCYKVSRSMASLELTRLKMWNY